MLDEFERLRALCVKVSRSTLPDIALTYLEQSNHLNIKQAQAMQLVSK